MAILTSFLLDEFKLTSFVLPLPVNPMQMGKFDFENPPVTCFRILMSASTFSYKYNKPSISGNSELKERSSSSIGITTGSTYGLLEHSILHIIVCLFSLVCTTEFRNKKRSFGYFQQDLANKSWCIFQLILQASNVVSLASPAEYSWLLFLFLKILLHAVFHSAVSSKRLSYTNIHLLSYLSDRAPCDAINSE